MCNFPHSFVAAWLVSGYKGRTGCGAAAVARQSAACSEMWRAGLLLLLAAAPARQFKLGAEHGEHGEHAEHGEHGEHAEHGAHGEHAAHGDHEEHAEHHQHHHHHQQEDAVLDALESSIESVFVEPDAAGSSEVEGSAAGQVFDLSR